MTISKEDLEAVARFLEQRQSSRKTVVAPQSRRGLVEEEIVPPHVLRQITEAEYRGEDRSKGFERLVLDSLTAMRAELAAVATSVPPAAVASKGAELAAVAGANASLRTEGKTEAVQLAADRADSHSLSARKRAGWGLAVSVATFLSAVAEILAHLLK